MATHTGWTVTQTKNSDGNIVDDRKVIMLRQDGQPANIQIQYVPHMLNKGYRLVSSIMGRQARNDKGDLIWITPMGPDGRHVFTEFEQIEIATPQGLQVFKPDVNLEDIPDVVRAKLPTIPADSRAQLKAAKEKLNQVAATQNKDSKIVAPPSEPLPQPTAAEKVEAPGKKKSSDKAPRRKPTTE